MVLCKINVWPHLRRCLLGSWMIIQEITYVAPAEKIKPRSKQWRTPLSRAPGRFTPVTASFNQDLVCKTMKMAHNADSIACTCLRLPVNAFLKISKPSTKENRKVRAVFSVLSDGGDTFIEVRVQAVRVKLRPLAAVRLTLALYLSLGYRPILLRCLIRL